MVKKRGFRLKQWLGTKVSVCVSKNPMPSRHVFCLTSTAWVSGPADVPPFPASELSLFITRLARCVENLIKRAGGKSHVRGTLQEVGPISFPPSEKDKKIEINDSFFFLRMHISTLADNDDG
ncbi:hypothetical protein CDAR_239931 [Caerostris darwini]|uniref:Uncharacterized protein n=1 Tax=Caerostris darwini TaxID=1538125 RepID=A0AAV4R028_9ARAC|nr:hypothetical protein CDAR_239931 [Caerostris darwini]